MKQLFFFLLLCTTFISCSKDKESENKQPVDNSSWVLTTQEAKDISSRFATLKGDILIKGTADIQEIGFCWDVVPNVSTKNQTVKIDSLKGRWTDQNIDFEYKLTELENSSTYYYRTYMISKGVVYYGDEKIFTTQPVDDILQFWKLEGVFDMANIDVIYDTLTKVLIFGKDQNFGGISFSEKIVEGNSYTIVSSNGSLNSGSAHFTFKANGSEWKIDTDDQYILQVSMKNGFLVIHFEDVLFVNTELQKAKSSGLFILN